MLRHQLEPAAQDFRALPGRGGTPSGGGCLRCIDGAHRVFDRGVSNLGEPVPRRGIHHGYAAALVPFAAYIKALGVEGGIGITGDLGVKRHGGKSFLTQFRRDRSPL
ncbi:hypothetical protein D3C80_1344480 [compost metagenome]